MYYIDMIESLTLAGDIFFLCDLMICMDFYDLSLIVIFFFVFDI